VTFFIYAVQNVAPVAAGRTICDVLHAAGSPRQLVLPVNAVVDVRRKRPLPGATSRKPAVPAATSRTPLDAGR
jgi:hypothetical protein